MAGETEHRSAGRKFQYMLERVEGLTFIAAGAMFIASMTALGWLPSMELRDRIAHTTPATMKDYTDLERLGRKVYGREGCAYCHSQLVRRITSDTQRFGQASQAWEYQYDYPHLLGTRRIGPDLLRESGARPDEWHYAHFYNPRNTVPESVMPPFPWLFKRDENNVIVPTREGRALVAYLNFLGRAARQATLAESENRRRIAPQAQDKP